ncbi:MAG: hypothetical protein WD042_07785 [Phycisphaeraceae bacterium]
MRPLSNQIRNPKSQIRNSPRGTVLILIMVMLALMALMGMAYLQVARVSRESMRDVSGDIDVVNDSVINLIAGQLLRDVVGSSGKFFDPADNIEPYDYPWNASSVTGGTMGQNDDLWLASISPEFSGNTWPHITALSDKFIANGQWNGGTGVFASGSPAEVDVFNGMSPWDTSISLGDANLVDADGDGVGDSRWMYAPVRQIRGIEYVTAVRIVDLAAMLNVNTASRITQGADTTYVTNSPSPGPRGYHNVDVDLSRFFRRAIGASATYNNELRDLLTAGNFTSGTNPTFGLTSPATYPDSGSFSTSPSGRLAQWIQYTRHNAESLYAYSLQDELALRYNNGLRNPNVISGLENKMPTLLRQSAISESTYTDVPGVSGPGDYAGYFQGGISSVLSRTFPDVRKYLTTRSATAMFAANHANIWNGDRTLKYDLLHQDGGASDNNTTRVNNIATRLDAILSIGAPTYESLSAAELGVVAHEFALAIQDYSDADSIPTEATVGGVKRYGMETLPFLREAYIQVAYQDQDISGNGNGDTWNPVGGSEAIAVEVGNPFDRAIDFDAANGPKVRIRIANDTNAFQLTGTLSARAVGIMVSNPASPQTEGVARDDLGSATSGLSFTTKWTAPAGNKVIFPVDGSDVTVELQVQVSGGGWVTYDRLTTSAFAMAASIDHSVAESAGKDFIRHGQASVRRYCRLTGGINSIHYISNKGISSNLAVPAGAYLAPDYKTTLDLLGNTTKGTAGQEDVSLANFQLPIANRPFFSVAELGWIHMFGFTNQGTGDFPQRFSGADGNSGIATERRFLNFGLTANVPSATRITHAAMVLDQFTTTSPAYDGINNTTGANGDPAAASDGKPSEQMIRGLININTVNPTINILAAPLPTDVSSISTLMSSVIGYRDNPAGRSDASYPSGLSTTRKGVASIGELMCINPGAGPNSPAWMQGLATPSGNFDLYPLPENVTPNGANATRYSIANDAEARMARFQFLSQVYTTRSDVFAAYIFIRGYQAGAFDEDPIESGRWIVIFDRSGVTSGDSSVRILGSWKVN